MPHRYDEPEQNAPARDADRQGNLGWGSLSLPLVVLALVWSFRIGGFCLGDAVLGALSLPAWSDGGTHYTVFYAYLFLVPAFLLGQRFRGQLFARTGGWFAGFLLAAFTLLYVLIGV